MIADIGLASSLPPPPFSLIMCLCDIGSSPLRPSNIAAQGQYMITLASELANESQQSHIRNAAGIAIKNALTGRESSTQSDLLHQWRQVSPEIKAQIKQLSLRALTSGDKKAASVGATAVAAIAGNELPFGEWGELIGQLLEFMGREEVGLRVATLQCIGFICEVVVSGFH